MKYRVAMAQILVEGGRPETNLARAVASIEAAGRQACQLVVLPECLDLGWTDPSAREMAEPIPGLHGKCLAEAARRAGLYVVAGFVERGGDRIYNAAILADRSGDLLLHYRKINGNGQSSPSGPARTAQDRPAFVGPRSGSSRSCPKPDCLPPIWLNALGAKTPCPTAKKRCDASSSIWLFIAFHVPSIVIRGTSGTGASGGRTLSARLPSSRAARRWRHHRGSSRLR